MLREQLTSRQDLIESLDSEPIFDYLIQHGVLDPDQRNDICKEVNRVNRNTALLQHLDDIGQTAVALLINALRQSGQLHLASSLDATHRIRPTAGTGYLGKQRHKGEVTIRIEVDSIKALFPVWEEGDPLEEKHGDTPEKEFKTSSIDNVHVTLSPRRAHKSYENMTMIGEHERTPRTWKIREYAYDTDQDSDGGKTSCWCFCRPKRRSKTKPKKKQNESKDKGAKQVKASQSKYDPNISPSRKSEKPPRHSTSPRRGDNSSQISLQTPTKSQTRDKTSKSNVQSSSPRKTNSGLSPAREVTPSRTHEMREIQLNGENKVRNGNNIVKYKNNVNNRKKNHSDNNKENTPPVINEQSGLTTPKKQMTKGGVKGSMTLDVNEPVEFCEMWKSYGPTFDKHVDTFFELLDNTLNMEIIKYFEQDRGTLVLQVYVERALVVCNICMKVDQLTQLQDDSVNSELVNVFEKILLQKCITDAMDIQDIRLKVVIDEFEVDLAKSELSED